MKYFKALFKTKHPYLPTLDLMTFLDHKLEEIMIKRSKDGEGAKVAA